MKRYAGMAAACVASAILTGCMGGGGSRLDSTPVTPDPNPVRPDIRQEETTALEFRTTTTQLIDLPPDGTDGIRVSRPYPDASIEITFTEGLLDRLERNRMVDDNASRRLEDGIKVLQDNAAQAYLQWIRHNPGSDDHFDRPFRIQVGETERLSCNNDRAAGCYSTGDNTVILVDDWIEDIYKDTYTSAVQRLFRVLTHEAGHQFGYRNPDGSNERCGRLNGCHAPRGSNSVMSYDPIVRYYVDREDIRHIPGATWNNSPNGRYTVWRSGEPSSIRRWGVWIDHEFRVSGMTDPSNPSGETLFIDEGITGEGWIRGQPSVNASPDTSATYSGTDNFLGVDLHPDYRALLRADANLRYTFSSNPTLGLRVNNFEAYKESNGTLGWHDHSFPEYGWGDFRYVMNCGPGGCSGIGANAKWYSNNDGAPTGWVGGVVDDDTNNYAGSFVAEKD